MIPQDALPSIAADLDTLLAKAAGKRCGFALFIFPLEDEGTTGAYIANVDETVVARYAGEMIDRWRAGEQPEVVALGRH
jgi:hypothetical protein